MEAVNRYYFSFQDTRSVLAETREEAEDIIYGAKEGWIDYHDSDLMFVYATNEDGELV
jgi:hypothetical protein